MEIWPTREKGLSEVDAYSSRTFHVCRTPLLLPQVPRSKRIWVGHVNRRHTYFKGKLSLIPFGQLALASYHLPMVGCELYSFLQVPYLSASSGTSNSLKLTKKLSEDILDLCIIKYHTHCVQNVQVQCRMKQSIFTYLHSIHGPTISLHDYASLFKVSWAWWHLAIKCQARHVFHVPCRSGL